MVGSSKIGFKNKSNKKGFMVIVKRHTPFFPNVISLSEDDVFVKKRINL